MSDDSDFIESDNHPPAALKTSDIEKSFSVQNYLMGRRFAVLLEPTGSHADSEWMEYWKKPLGTSSGQFALLFDLKIHDEIEYYGVRNRPEYINP